MTGKLIFRTVASFSPSRLHWKELPVPLEDGHSWGEERQIQARGAEVAGLDVENSPHHPAITLSVSA